MVLGLILSALQRNSHKLLSAHGLKEQNVSSLNFEDIFHVFAECLRVEIAYFIKSFKKVEKYRICPFAMWKVFHKVIILINELCPARLTFSEYTLKIIENVLGSYVGGQLRGYHVFKCFAEDVCQGNWTKVCWITGISF
jgi:hypothetical protein